MRDEEITLEEYVTERLEKHGKCSKYEVLQEVYKEYQVGKDSAERFEPPHTFMEYNSQVRLFPLVLDGARPRSHDLSTDDCVRFISVLSSK